MKEIILIVISLLTPKADSTFKIIQDSYKIEAARYNIILPEKEIQFKLTANLTDDTLAVSEEITKVKFIVSINLGYYIYIIHEQGKLYTLLYHEFTHIYLNKDDCNRCFSIMNYNFVEIDILNNPHRKKFLYNLFKDD